MKPAVEHVFSIWRCARVTRHQQAYRCLWIGFADEAGIIEFIRKEIESTVTVIWCDERFITEAVIQREMLRGFPGVLQIESKIGLPWIEFTLSTGGKTRRISGQEVG